MWKTFPYLALIAALKRPQIRLNPSKTTDYKSESIMWKTRQNYKELNCREKRSKSSQKWTVMALRSKASTIVRKHRLLKGCLLYTWNIIPEQ